MLARTGTAAARTENTRYDSWSVRMNFRTILAVDATRVGLELKAHLALMLEAPEVRRSTVVGFPP